MIHSQEFRDGLLRFVRLEIFKFDKDTKKALLKKVEEIVKCPHKADDTETLTHPQTAVHHSVIMMQE